MPIGTALWAFGLIAGFLTFFAYFGDKINDFLEWADPIIIITLWKGGEQVIRLFEHEVTWYLIVPLALIQLLRLWRR